ncbi:glycosyltransferase family 1 protein [Sphingomonas lutea]|uniref:Glycosyltransferase family 1 protein n=1 Tax=Sphingomonas lutea TaxID=1045317 RepID=A0A7G9SJY2_9SPHN|nr:glycosyltransferase family 1 protein [Sphingomonas lutea]QNN68157.1 glycosyltransferase family 1 protein [Sphingomonas lutea]
MLTRVGVPVETSSEQPAKDPHAPTLICFSHLRWNFVFQRPQHLMSRFARTMPVIYWEEPVEIGRKETPFLKVREADDVANVRIVVPHLPEGMPEDARDAALARLLDAHVATIKGPLLSWYYTPMMLPFSRHLAADVTVFDAMDELSKFKFAPVKLLELEQELIDRADLVFTGGSSLYEAKKDRHHSVHCFPSSVDRAHFAQARARLFDPADQEELPKPRLGFYGVLDERFDVDLLAKVAEMRPDWSFVMVGPVVKISDEDLPKRPNIHYLGSKTYGQLPAYLAGWDVALMPFAMNESTEFISPTKTPEYLAGGKPVVSTPVRDVVRHYGHLEGVQIAGDAEGFAEACDKALALSRDPESGWLAEADLMLSAASWDIVQARMAGLIDQVMGEQVDNPALLVAAE